MDFIIGIPDTKKISEYCEWVYASKSNNFEKMIKYFEKPNLQKLTHEETENIVVFIYKRN